MPTEMEQFRGRLTDPRSKRPTLESALEYIADLKDKGHARSQIIDAQSEKLRLLENEIIHLKARIMGLEADLMVVERSL